MLPTSQAKGNFEVDMVWADGQLKEATIVSNAGGPCNLRYGDMTLKFNTAKGKTYKVVVADGKLKRQ